MNFHTVKVVTSNRTSVTQLLKKITYFTHFPEQFVKTVNRFKRTHQMPHSYSATSKSGLVTLIKLYVLHNTGNKLYQSYILQNVAPYA